MIFFLFYFGKKESDNCQSCLNTKIEKFRTASKSRTLNRLQNGPEKSPISVLGLYVWVQSLNIITLHFAPKHLHSRSLFSISFDGRGEEKKKKKHEVQVKSSNKPSSEAMNKKRRIFQANPKDPSPIRTTFPTEFRSSESESNAAKGLSSNFSHLEFEFSNLISL